MNNGAHWRKFFMENPDAQREIEQSYGSESRDLHEIDASDHDLARGSTRAVAALVIANDPPFLFRYGGLLARIEPDDNGVLFAQALNPDRLRKVMSDTMYWYTKDGPAYPPMAVVRNVLATPDLPFPRLTRIVHAPVIAPDGSLHVQPGYHPASRCYYQPEKGFVLPPIPERPSNADVVHALEIIIDLIADFPFVGDSERAHAIAFLLQPFVRDLIDGPTPLHLIEKPEAGTGAGLLAAVLTLPAIGSDLPVMTEAPGEAEWRKRITSKLLGGPSIVLIDNLRYSLDSGALSAAIASRVWEDRMLGLSQMVHCPVRCAWLATGNNPNLSNEIARRTVRIRLDAKVERPWERTGFRHPDLIVWARERRVDLVWAALVLSQAWLANGRPPGQVLLGTFEDWARTIGGILGVAGIPGFLGNRSELYEVSDQESAIWKAFFSAWWDQYADQILGVSELFGLAGDLDLGNGAERSQRTRLGQLLRSKRDRQFGGLRLVAAGTRKGAQLWKLERAVTRESHGKGRNDEPGEPGEPVCTALSSA